MNISITPKRLSGSVIPPPSKSMAHRLIIAAALSGGTSTLTGISFSQDILATLNCISALGASWQQIGTSVIRIHGLGGTSYTGALPQLDCGESGSTLRFMIPIALAVAGGGIFTGRGRLMERPQKPYFDLFCEKDILYKQSGGALTVQGQLTPGEYRLPGDVSSQFFTGLLYALPLLNGQSTVVSTTPLESADYITLTMGAMEKSGVPVRFSKNTNTFLIRPATYRPIELPVEADWSQAAFWYAALVLGSQLQIQGMDEHSAQGDKIVAKLAGTLSISGDVTIDMSGCPDLLPPLAVMAAVRKGTTIFCKAARLRLKESDRLATVAAMLTALGGKVIELPDSLIVYGVSNLTGGIVDGSNDHRIVMAAAIAATRCRSPVTILGAEAVNKSYPDFWKVYEDLGGEVHVL